MLPYWPPCQPRYAAGQLIPPSRIPGFIFHQTERTADNGTNPCFSSSKLCYDSNARDFDLLGYKYSLLSTIGTAGQNNVLTMIPARDPEEFQLFPAADLAFIKRWLAWTDTNLRFLRNTMPIAQLGEPTVGEVDGTASMDGDQGCVEAQDLPRGVGRLLGSVIPSFSAPPNTLRSTQVSLPL